MAASKHPIEEPRLQLVPASGRSRLWLWLLGMVLPVALSVAASLIAKPATSTADLFASDWRTRLSAGFNLPDQLLGPLFVAGVTLAICLLLDRMLRRQRLRLDRNRLEVLTTFYRQRLALSQLQLDRARVIELGEHPELRPWLKSNGFALPGFRSGWFRTRGFKKLFLPPPAASACCGCRPRAVMPCCCSRSGRRPCSSACARWQGRRRPGNLRACAAATPS
jgi:hypothetical protein